MKYGKEDVLTFSPSDLLTFCNFRKNWKRYGICIGHSHIMTSVLWNYKHKRFRKTGNVPNGTEIENNSHLPCSLPTPPSPPSPALLSHAASKGLDWTERTKIGAYMCSSSSTARANYFVFLRTSAMRDDRCVHHVYSYMYRATVRVLMFSNACDVWRSVVTPLPLTCETCARSAPFLKERVRRTASGLHITYPPGWTRYAHFPSLRSTCDAIRSVFAPTSPSPSLFTRSTFYLYTRRAMRDERGASDIYLIINRAAKWLFSYKKAREARPSVITPLQR